MIVGLFPPAGVIADSVAASLFRPLFQSRFQRPSPAGLELHSVSAGPVGPLSLLLFDQAVIRRLVGGASLGVRPFLDSSVVLFSFRRAMMAYW